MNTKTQQRQRYDDEAKKNDKRNHFANKIVSLGFACRGKNTCSTTFFKREEGRTKNQSIELASSNNIQNETTKNKNSVSFSPEVSAYDHIHLFDLSKEEIQNTWWNDRDMHDIKQAAKTIIRQMKEQCQEKCESYESIRQSDLTDCYLYCEDSNEQHGLTDKVKNQKNATTTVTSAPPRPPPNVVCCRGLELHLDRQWKIRRSRGLEAVLKTQQMLRHLPDPKAEMIAQVYRMLTSESRSVARAKGDADYAEVIDSSNV